MSDPAEVEPTGAFGNFPGSAYTTEEAAWLKAVEAYQKRAKRKFLTCVDYLRIARALGYRKESP